LNDPNNFVKAAQLASQANELVGEKKNSWTSM